jgi:hypothetical protein
MIQVTLSRIPSQEFRVVLNDQYCTIWLYQRGRRLYMDLWSGEHAVCKGTVCQEGADVLQSGSPWFKGTLHFHDFEGKAPPGWEGLESRWVLLYVPPDEALPERFRH